MQLSGGCPNNPRNLGTLWHVDPLDWNAPISPIPHVPSGPRYKLRGLLRWRNRGGSLNLIPG